LAVRILALGDRGLADALDTHRAALAAKAQAADARLNPS
jgi:hypothetical protein